jgi:hypothetical protein
MVIFGYVLLVVVIIVLVGVLIHLKTDIKRSNVGDFVVIRDDDGKMIISLEMNGDPSEVEKKPHIWFDVKRRIAD